MILMISAMVLFFAVLWILYHNDVFGWFCSVIVGMSQKYRCRNRPKRIILVRHGESQGNQDSTIYSTVPDHAIGLTEKGQKQARDCGNKLKKIIGSNETLFCYTSPFRRSVETCELICEAFSQEEILGVREDPRIREQEWGNFQDLATRQTTITERKKIGRFFYRFRNGESGADVYDRVSSFIDSLFREMQNKQKPNNNILIVSHGLFIRLFLMRYFRWTVEKFHTLENFDNCAYCILERSNEGGSFNLITELKSSPIRKLIETENSNEIFNEKSLNEEINGLAHVKKIENEEKKEN